jgi:hypothetical protein
VAILSFVAASGLVLSSSLLVAARLRFRDPLDSALAFVTVGLAQVLGSLLFAGVVLNDLTRVTVLALNAAFFAALIGLELLRPALRLPGRLVLSRGRLASEIRGHPWLYALALLAAAEFVWRLTVAYVLPPYGFDALWYHLTAVAGWLQAERIALNPLALWSSVYPLNGEVYFTWPALFLRSDTFVDSVQLGFSVIGGAAVAGIARSLGIGGRGAAATGLLFFLTPIVISQSTANSVDLVFTSTFLVAYHFLLRFLQSRPFGGRDGDDRQPNGRLVALAGLAAGIALGAKSLGILYCGALALLLLGHLVVSVLRRRLPMRMAMLPLFVFLVPLIALGGFWYARTWVRFGNPFYPVRVEVLGHTFFAGLPLENFLSAPLHRGPWWKEVLWQWHQDQFLWIKAHYYTHDGRPSGFGPLWGYLAAPLLPVFALATLLRNRPAMVNFLLPVILVFLAQPYKWWSRFTMLLLAAGTIAVAYVIEKAPGKLATALKGATLVLVVVGLWFCTAKIDNGFTAPGILRRLADPAERTAARQAVYGRAFAFVERARRRAHIGADTSTPFFGGAPRIWYFYPLFGSTFDHHVYPLRGRDERGFLSYLARRRIDYVVVAQSGGIAALATEAARSGCLRLAAESDVPPARAYAVQPRCGRGSAG